MSDDFAMILSLMITIFFDIFFISNLIDAWFVSLNSFLLPLSKSHTKSISYLISSSNLTKFDQDFISHSYQPNVLWIRPLFTIYFFFNYL